MGRSGFFHGVEVLEPDAYSSLDVSRLLTPTSGGIGIVALIGEADGGKPGISIIQGGASPAAVKRAYKSGPLANMCRLALRSGQDGLVPAGASTVLAVKTNNSTPSVVQIGGLASPVAEVTRVTCVADTSGSLDGKYFLIADAAGSVAVWFDETGTTAQPAHGAARSVHITTVTSGMTAAQVAGAVATALSADAAFASATVSSTTQVLIVDGAAGPRSGQAAGTSGFTVAEVTHGVAADNIGALKLTTRQYGVLTALYTAEISTVGGQRFVTVRDENGVPETSVGVGSKPYLTLQYTGNGTATLALSWTGAVLNLVGTVSGQTDSSVSFTIPVTTLTLGQVKALVLAKAGWTAVTGQLDEAFKAKDLDLILSAVDAKTASVKFVASIKELIDWAARSSQLYTVERGDGNNGDSVVSTLVTTSFSGGTRGTTTNSQVQDMLNQLLGYRVNIIVPLFSSDSQDGSSVVAAAINSQIKDHVQTRSGILGRSECQAYVGFSGNKDAFKAESARMGSRYVAVTSQKISDLDIDGNLVQYPEYAFAVVCAQTQSGSPVGTPLTGRILPVSGITQDVSWNPVENLGEMIKAGCLIASTDENNQIHIVGGYTSWLADDNNANIYVETVESLAVFGFNHRKFMKARFVGRSAFTSQDVIDAIAESVKSERDSARSIKGYDLKLTKILQVGAGEISYEVAVIPWEGIVFVFSEIVAIRAGQAA